MGTIVDTSKWNMLPLRFINGCRYKLLPTLSNIRCLSKRLVTIPRVVDTHSTWDRTHTGHIPSPCTHTTQTAAFSTDTCLQKKDKGKKDKKGKGKSSGMVPSVEEMKQLVPYSKFQSSMSALLDELKQEYNEKLSIRAASGSLDHLTVETEDGSFHLIQLAQVAQKGPHMIMINMVTVPQYIPEVKKAIAESGLNLNPQQEGTTLFVPLPKVTREHRENLAKGAKTVCDKTHQKMREIRNLYVSKISKKTGVSDDLVRGGTAKIHSDYESYCADADAIMKAKQKELLGS